MTKPKRFKKKKKDFSLFPTISLRGKAAQQTAGDLLSAVVQRRADLGQRCCRQLAASH